MNRANFSILLISLFVTVSLISGADTTEPEAAEEGEEAVLQQKLSRLNEEVAATKARLSAIHDSRITPPISSEQKKEEGTEAVAAEATEAVTAEAPNSLSDFVKRVSLWNSVFDKNAFKGPAGISYLRPGSGPSSIAIDAGLRIEMQPMFPWSQTISSAVGVDYHRNTAPGSLKDLFQAGGQFEHSIGFAKSDGVLLNTTGDISYKIDRIRRLDSLNASIRFNPVIRFEKIGLPALEFLNIDNFHRVVGMRWQWQPFVGAVYEETVQTGGGVNSGHHGIIDYGVEFLVYPFYTKLRKQVEVIASYKGWEPIDPTGVFGGEQRSSFYEAQLTYRFSSLNPIAIGAETSKTVDWGVTLKYQNGTNLETGDKNLDLLSLAFTGKF